MKKLQKTLPLLMLVLMLSLTGMAGCQMFAPQQPQQSDIDTVPRDRRIGVIQSLGAIKTDSQGTHLLTMDDGSTILLKSLAINLNDSKYFSKKIEVSGLLTFTTDNKQIMEVESIDVLEDAVSSTQQEAIAWAEYVNAGAGFRLKFRNDFKLAESGNKVTFTREVASNAMMTQQTIPPSSMEIASDHEISFEVTGHAAGKTLGKDFLGLKDDKESAILAAGFTKSRFGLNGIDAYKKVSGQAIDFVFEANGKFYQITYTGGNDAQSLEDQNVFYDVLASFQLLDGSSTQQSTTAPEADTLNNNSQKDLTTSVTHTIPTTDEDGTESHMNVEAEIMANSSSSSTPTSPSPNPTPLSPSAGDSSVKDTQPLSSTPTTQEQLPGYSTFNSTGYKFNLQYPKGWYFGQTTATDSDVIRRYDFGTKPVDEQPGVVNLDLVSGGVPSGTTYTVGDKMLIKTSSGDTTSYYYKGKNGRVYRVSGPAGMDSSLRNMMETLQEQ